MNEGTSLDIPSDDENIFDRSSAVRPAFSAKNEKIVWTRSEV